MAAFTFTPAQYRAQIIRNAATDAEMVEAARKVTDSGKGGPKGKRYRGYFFHQHVEAFVRAVSESYATDAELQPKCEQLARMCAPR